MRFRYALLVTFVLAVPLALPHFAHASIPFFGPIIPQANDLCAAGWGMLVTVVNNIIELAITIGIVFVAPLTIAYAGFLFVVNAVNPAGKEQAKKMLLNTIVGIAIALAGWLIVDAVMAVLYNPSSFGAQWYQLVTSGGAAQCLTIAGVLNQSPSATAVSGNTPTVTGVDQNGASSLSYGAAGSACDSATIQQQDPGISTTEANQLACIAQHESTCGAQNQNYNWGASSGASTAYGPYQVLLKSNSSCYDNSVCETAAGTPGTPLNCASGFNSNGDPISGSAVVAKCTTAASNIGCSAAAAQCLLSQQSFQAAYATDPLVTQCASGGS